MVGRQGEVAWRRERWQWACEGQRQCARLSGEAGIGKTTVVDLLVASLPAPAEVALGRGHCVALAGAGEAYLPRWEAVGQLGQSPHWDALRRVLQHYAPTWLGHVPALLGAGERERQRQALAGVPPGRMLRELAEALEGWTQTTPLVLGLEDLHGSDGATVNLLTSLAQRRAPARLLVLGTYRPVDVVVQAHPRRGRLQELRGRGGGEDLTLELFLPAEVEAYAAARLGGAVTGMLQQYEAARHLLTEILQRAQASEHHFYDAELYRLQGEVLLAQADPRHQAEAEASWHQALAVACRQAAKMWELF